MGDFKDFLLRKQINPEGFRMGLPKEWERWNAEFEQIGEQAFDLQKKFLLNPMRLQFPLSQRPVQE